MLTFLITLFSVGDFFVIIGQIIIFVLLLGLIILIHEAGHFFFAKRAGILCHEFSIGMGPCVYHKQFGETKFCLRAIPIGGYVSMAGEEVSNEIIERDSTIGLNFNGDGYVTEFILNPEMQATKREKVVDYNLYGKDGEQLYIKVVNENNEEVTYNCVRNAYYVFNPNKRLQITPYDRSFESKSLWSRFKVIFAGPLMNLLLGILIFIIYWSATGIPNTNSTVIGSVSEGYPADGVLLEGDDIVSVNGVSVDTWKEFSSILDTYPELGITEITLTVNRNDEIKTFTLNALVAVNSCGNITNYNMTNATIPSGMSGVQVGTISLNYNSDLKSGEVGLTNGDILLSVGIDNDVDDKTNEIIWTDVNSWSDILTLFADVEISDCYFKFYSQSKGEVVTSVTPARSYSSSLLKGQQVAKETVKIGVSPEMHFDLVGVIKYSFTSFWDDFTKIFDSLGRLFGFGGPREVGLNDMSGVVGIFSLVQQYMSLGFLMLLTFVAFLSINIGMVNLLPIPALDGGRIVFLLYELITRRKPNKKVENTLNTVMLILLMILMLYITTKDIINLF